MSAREAELASLACDYITGVATDRPTSQDLHTVGSELFRLQREMGNESRHWGMSGFKGWKCGQVELGERNDEFILRLHSDAAQRWWRKVFESSSHVTRYDVQATVWYPRGPTRAITTARRQALKYSKGKEERSIVRWIQDNRGGYTLYLGSRESNVFGRIYDMWSKHPMDQWKGCVRYEVQFNSRLARIVANVLAKKDSPKDTFASYCTQFFSSRGVDLQLPYTSGVTFCCPRNASDSDRKLVWLAEAVRPSVLALIALGRGEEVLRALGLIDESEAGVVHTDQHSTN